MKNGTKTILESQMQMVEMFGMTPSDIIKDNIKGVVSAGGGNAARRRAAAIVGDESTRPFENKGWWRMLIYANRG